MDKAFVGQMCIFKKDKTEVVGEIIKTDHDGKRLLIEYDGEHYTRWLNDVELV